MKRPLLHLLKWRREWLWQNQCWRLPCSTNLAKLKHNHPLGMYSIWVHLLICFFFCLHVSICCRICLCTCSHPLTLSLPFPHLKGSEYMQGISLGTFLYCLHLCPYGFDLYNFDLQISTSKFFTRTKQSRGTRFSCKKNQFASSSIWNWLERPEQGQFLFVFSSCIPYMLKTAVYLESFNISKQDANHFVQ